MWGAAQERERDRARYPTTPLAAGRKRSAREDGPDQIGNRHEQKVLGREMIITGISFQKTCTPFKALWRMFRTAEFHASLRELVRREERKDGARTRRKVGKRCCCYCGCRRRRPIGRPAVGRQTWLVPRGPYFTEKKPFPHSAVVDGDREQTGHRGTINKKT